MVADYQYFLVIKFFEACQLWKAFSANSLDFLHKVEFLARFYFFQENLQEDFVDVLDWVGGYVGGQGEDLTKWDSFEVLGGLRATGIEVDGDEVPEDDEVEYVDSL